MHAKGKFHLAAQATHVCRSNLHVSNKALFCYIYYQFSFRWFSQAKSAGRHLFKPLVHQRVSRCPNGPKAFGWRLSRASSSGFWVLRSTRMCKCTPILKGYIVAHVSSCRLFQRKVTFRIFVVNALRQEKKSSNIREDCCKIKWLKYDLSVGTEQNDIRCWI